MSYKCICRVRAPSPHAPSSLWIYFGNLTQSNKKMALLYYFRKQNAIGSYLAILPRKCYCTVLSNREYMGTIIQLLKKCWRPTQLKVWIRLWEEFPDAQTNSNPWAFIDNVRRHTRRTQKTRFFSSKRKMFTVSQPASYLWSSSLKKWSLIQLSKGKFFIILCKSKAQ